MLHCYKVTKSGHYVFSSKVYLILIVYCKLSKKNLEESVFLRNFAKQTKTICYEPYT